MSIPGLDAYLTASPFDNMPDWVEEAEKLLKRGVPNILTDRDVNELDEVLRELVAVIEDETEDQYSYMIDWWTALPVIDGVGQATTLDYMRGLGTLERLLKIWDEEV